MDSRPLMIGPTNARLLKPIPQSSRQVTEEWLQGLIYASPSILPTREIDGRYGSLIPLGREVAVRSGYIDILFVSPTGQLCVVETKLWRNPGAHRTVLAQIIDYAKDLAAMDYVAFERAVLAAQRDLVAKSTSLHDLARGRYPGALDELEFETELRRSMKRGEFLLLIVGDRIRPEVALLSESIQGTPHLEFTTALVELRCYATDIGDEPTLVVPAVVGRTLEVTRGVIRIRYEQETPPAVDVEVTDVTQKPGTKTTMAVFLKSLPSALEEPFRASLDKWNAHGDPWLVYWGLVGFSLRLRRGTGYRTVFDAYPEYMSVFMHKWLDGFDDPTAAYSDYRARLERFEPVRSMLGTSRRYVRYDQLSPEQVAEVLSATDELTTRLATL